MGVVGAAIKGFGKALKVAGRNKASKKLFKDASGGLKYPVIKSVKPAKRLTERRKNTEDLFKIREKSGLKPSKKISEGVKKTSALNDKYDKAIKAKKVYNKNLKRKVIGGAGATLLGVTGAHEGAKRKWPKYKKTMESDIVIKDGKLRLRPKKKK